MQNLGFYPPLRRELLAPSVPLTKEKDLFHSGWIVFGQLLVLARSKRGWIRGSFCSTLDISFLMPARYKLIPRTTIYNAP